MKSYISQFTHTDVENALGKALNPDDEVTSGSDNLVTSGAVANAVGSVEEKLNVGRVVFFAGFKDSGEVQASGGSDATPDGVYFYRSAGKFGQKVASMGTVGSSEKYYQVWNNMGLWADEDGYPLDGVQYVCMEDNAAYIRNAEDGELVKISGDEIVVDAELDKNSENPVQNKVVAGKVGELEAFDTLADVLLQTPPQITEYDLTFTTSIWKTLVVPFDFVCPEGLVLYIVTGLNKSTGNLVLEQMASGGDMCKAHTPYVVKYTGDNDEGVPLPKTFRLSGTFCSAYHHESYLRAGIGVGSYKQFSMVAGQATAEDIYYIGADGKYYSWAESYENPLAISPYRVIIIDRSSISNTSQEGTSSDDPQQNVEVDEELSETSANPVENRAIYAAISNQNERINNIEQTYESKLFYSDSESSESINNLRLLDSCVDGLFLDMEYDASKEYYLQVSIYSSGGANYARVYVGWTGGYCNCSETVAGYVCNLKNASGDVVGKVLLKSVSSELSQFSPTSKIYVSSLAFKKHKQLAVVTRELEQSDEFTSFGCIMDEAFGTWGIDFRTDANDPQYDYKYRCVRVSNNYRCSDAEISTFVAFNGAVGLYYDGSVTVPSSGIVSIDKTKIKTSNGKSVYGGSENDDDYNFYSIDFIVNGRSVIVTCPNDNVCIRKNDSISDPVKIKPGDTLTPSYYEADVYIIYIGTYGGFTTEDDYLWHVEQVVNNTDGKFIVMCPPTGAILNDLGYDSLVRIETEMHKRYGNKFFNIRKFLIGMMDEQTTISISASDRALASSGRVPTAFYDETYWYEDSIKSMITSRLWSLVNALYLTDRKIKPNT